MLLFLWSKYWERVLENTQAKKVYIVSYYSVLGWGLCLACNSKGIKVIEIQHGVISEGTAQYTGWKSMPVSGYKCLPNSFYLWGEYEKKELQKYYKNGDLELCVKGHLWVQYYLKNQELFEKNFQKNVKEIRKIFSVAKKNILIAHQAVPELENCYKPLLQVIRKKKDWNFYFRKHPAGDKLSRNNAPELFMTHKLQNFFMHDPTSIPLYFMILNTDCIVTPNSSVCVEGDLLNKRTIFLLDSVVANRQKQRHKKNLVATTSTDLVKLIERATS